MSASPAILNKIKLLQKLAASPNQHEADNARTKVSELIAKHGITEQELSSIQEKVFYTDKEFLYSTIGLEGWKQQLALGIANYFDCQIIQEVLVPFEGTNEYRHFVYGDEQSVSDTQTVFHAFLRKIERLVSETCNKEDTVYRSSYCEGVVEAIKTNIALYGLDLPDIKRPVKSEDITSTASQTLAPVDKKKDQPTDKRANVSDQSTVEDVWAYFQGLHDGRNISLREVLDTISVGVELLQS